MSTPLMDTLYDTFLMMDHTGLAVATPGKCGTQFLKPIQVVALYRFFKRPEVLDFVLTTMRADLDEKAATNEKLGIALALIDHVMGTAPVKRQEPEEEEEEEEREFPSTQIATLPSGEPIMLTYGDSGPNGVEVTLGELEISFDLGAEARDVHPVVFTWSPTDYVYLTVAQVGHLKEILSGGTLDRLITLGREQDQRRAA